MVSFCLLCIWTTVFVFNQYTWCLSIGLPIIDHIKSTSCVYRLSLIFHWWHHCEQLSTSMIHYYMMLLLTANLWIASFWPWYLNIIMNNLKVVLLILMMPLVHIMTLFYICNAYILYSTIEILFQTIYTYVFIYLCNHNINAQRERERDVVNILRLTLIKKKVLSDFLFRSLDLGGESAGFDTGRSLLDEMLGALTWDNRGPCL